MSTYQVRKTPGDTAWFRHDRFGMFIHWGLYSMPARHEWVKNKECIPEAKYDQYFKYFNPDLYDAREWARQAKAAGMNPENLKEKFYGKVAFVGGVDTQDLLPFGTPEQVAKRVKELREIFPTGLVVSPSHEALQADVPPENVKALFDEAGKFY